MSFEFANITKKITESGNDKMQTKKYFHNRNKYLNAFVNRYILGRREIDTMGALLKYFFSYDIASTNVFLDIGCGDKFLQLPIEEHGITYIGVDIDQCNFESDKLKFSDKTIDIAVMYSVIEHLKNPDNLLTEIQRILKPDGFLIIETPNWDYSSKIFYDDYTHVRPYSSKSLLRLLNDYGFHSSCCVPNLRCKPIWLYKTKLKFKIASLLPFNNDARLVPTFLKGKALGMIAIAMNGSK